MSDVKQKECPVESIHKSRPSAIDSACASCPNRKPSEVERELRECLEEIVKAWDDDGHGFKLYKAIPRAKALLAKGSA